MLPRFATLALIGVVLSTIPSQAQDVNGEIEDALTAAALKNAPSVVKIETSGGREVITAQGGQQAGVRKGVGPTTGLIVDADGFIVSSAFNFANNPTDIFVTVPGQPRMVAKIVANDETRMLTLLKVEAKKLPVPKPFPKKDAQVGQWSVALGRALDPEIAELPSMSIGIISATGRIWGKALQTDAKISPINYGGPLVGIDGRVFGVLVPASPRGGDETAGVEWYDSGIGFAIPLEDIFTILPELKKGKDLRRGMIGITVADPENMYNIAVKVDTVAKASAAEEAGIKKGDIITKIDNVAVSNYADLRHALGPKYEGDTVKVTVTRGDKTQTFDKLKLAGEVAVAASPFLGILPLRDDPERGVVIRYVYLESAAAKAGLKVGDRITKFAPAQVPQPTPVTTRERLRAMVGSLAPAVKVKIEVVRKDQEKPETIEMTLGELPFDLLAKEAPLPSSEKKALAKPVAANAPKGQDEKKVEPKIEEKKDEPKDEEKKEEIETGLVQRTNKTLGRDYWLYIPTNYDKNVSHGVILWFHAAGRGGKDAEDMVRIWRDYCDLHHFILMGPKSENETGWLPSETEEVLQDVRTVMGEYTTDKTRILAHGMGIGGQMAIYIGFNARDLIRGVATTGTVVGRDPKDVVPNQPLSFYMVAGKKDPLIKEINAGIEKLKEKKYPVIYREIEDFGKEYLDENSFDELRRWMDSLDRI